MAVFTDQTGREIRPDKIPQRIISLVPSQTELLADLGLGERVIGITRFCVHPREWFLSKTRTGGTKQVNMDTIHRLKPDLIIANKEENVKEQIEDLAKHYPVWISDVNNLNDACEMIDQIGLMTNTHELAKKMIGQIRENFAQLENLSAGMQTYNSTPGTAYLIWRDPYMTVGSDTFIHSMLEAAGFENLFKNFQRYPEITIDELKNAQLLLLSSEPFPFKEKHRKEIQEELPDTKIVLVDGEMFSWYGSRLLLTPGYFQKLKRLVGGM
jgi:ABC-type Fe3+-hydroxamate transport system substrate-binding protein